MLCTPRQPGYISLLCLCTCTDTGFFYQMSEMDVETRMPALFLLIPIFHAFKSYLKAECKQDTDKNN